MKKVIFFLFAVLLSTGVASAQTMHPPRDPDKLISRVQAYWTYMVSGQKTKALDLVLPEKRDAFLATVNAFVLDAQVEGLNFSEDPLHASVRIRTHTVQPASMEMGKDAIGMGQEPLPFTQNWIWKAGKPKVAGGPTTGNWYLDVSDFQGPPIRGAGNKVGSAEIQTDIDQHLTLPETILNFGTVTKGGPDINIDVPVVYSGDRPLVVELATPYPGFSVSAVRGGLTSQSKHFTLFFDSSDWESAALAVPLHIRFARDGAAVDKVITLQGTVFAPVSFRQVPTEAKPGEPFSAFIRNNTTDSITLQSLSTEDRVDVLRVPETMTIGPNQESEVVLRLKLGETLNVLYLTTKLPVSGISQFSYRVRTGH